jgi:hypothetical protein
MDFVNSIAIFRRLSPLHYFLCALGNFMRRKRGEEEILYNNIVVGARYQVKNARTHLYTHTKAKQL